MSSSESHQRSTEYYAIRADQERARAERSGDPAARRVHLELAQRYAAQVPANDSAAIA